MRFKDINKRYTEIVSEYITKGYTINTASMGGSQGELANIDLTNGTEIIRILVNSFTDWNSAYGLEGIEIVVGRCTDDVIPNDYRYNETIWNDHLDVLSCERIYKVGEDRKNGILYGTIDEANTAIEKRVARYSARNPHPERFVPTKEMMEIATRIVREKMGFMRIRAIDVKLTKYENRYSVSYHGNTYKLH